MQPVLDGPGDLTLLDRYWRAANYLSVGQIYLLDNALLMATRSGPSILVC
jgi:xylulose-5-phosphate/fructose-6-phosphate phosphoketolase